jgi:hypothetical protein
MKEAANRGSYYFHCLVRIDHAGLLKVVMLGA